MYNPFIFVRMQTNVTINYRVLSADYNVAIEGKRYTILVMTLAETLGRRLPFGVKHTECILIEETLQFSPVSVRPGTIIPVEFTLYKSSDPWGDTYQVKHVYKFKEIEGDKI